MKPILTNEEFAVGIWNPLKMNQMRFKRQMKELEKTILQKGLICGGENGKED